MWLLEADSGSPPLDRLARGVVGGGSLSICVSERLVGVLIGGWVQGYWLPCSEMEVGAVLGQSGALPKTCLLCNLHPLPRVSTICSGSQGIQDACTDYTVGLY